MESLYAQIITDTGVVVNLQLVDQGQTLDSSFTWVSLTGVNCTDGTLVVIGCIYNGTTFASMPLDTYSRCVVMSTDFTTDTYLVTDIARNVFEIDVSYGTAQATVYSQINGTNVPSLPLAKSQVANNFALAQMAYVQSFYSQQTQIQLLVLYLAAQSAGNLPNRMAYIAQLFTWIASIVTYDVSFGATVQASTTAAQACALDKTWNFSANISTNPAVTAQAAELINS